MNPGYSTGYTSASVSTDQYPGHNVPGYPGQPQSPVLGFPGPAQGYQVSDHLPHNYTQSLHSLQPLQVYMSSKMAAMPGQPYPRNYIDLLISNVGKMLAQASLGLR